MNLLNAMNFVSSKLATSPVLDSTSLLSSGLEFDDMLFTSATFTDPFSIAVELVHRYIYAHGPFPTESQRQQHGQFLQAFGKKISSITNLVPAVRFLLDRIDSHLAPSDGSTALVLLRLLAHCQTNVIRSCC